MSTAKAYKLVLDRIGASTGTMICAILLTLPSRHPMADTVDSEGRSVFLVGKHGLGDGDAAALAIQAMCDCLARGEYPDQVHPVVFAPQASQAIAAAIDGPQDTEVLVHGPRGTGKTHTLAAAAMINAEWDLRTGHAGPFLVMWLHDSLLSASTKTGRSLCLPMWGGLWHLRDDARRAICTIGGRELVAGDFVGCQDEASAQRLRVEVHMVLGEELVASMSDGTGIKEDQYELARSSTMRFPTRLRIAMSATNPGGPDTWPYVRFIGPMRRANTVAVQVMPSDRLTDEEQQAQLGLFANSLTLHKRLALGEWVMAEQGAAVAEGFDVAVHVSRVPLAPHPQYLLGIGWDGGHSPSAVIGQHQRGQVQIYAALNKLHAGVLELIESELWPWLSTHAPWALRDGGMSLVHIIDPNMATPGQVSMTESAEKMILAKLGGRIIHGAVRWPPRREAVLRVLAPRHEQGRVPLQIDDTPDTALLIQAWQGRWFYPVDPKTDQIDRTGAKKPNSPWADVGDASAYLCGWLLGGDLMEVTPPHQLVVEQTFSLEAMV